MKKKKGRARGKQKVEKVAPRGAKAKKKSVAKTRVKVQERVTGEVGVGRDASPVEMRQRLTNIVSSRLADVAHALLDEAVKGQLAPAKYLLGEAGVLPPEIAEAKEEQPEEDCLTRRLFQRLGIPEGPTPSQLAEMEENGMVVAGSSGELEVGVERRETAGSSPSLRDGSE